MRCELPAACALIHHLLDLDPARQVWMALASTQPAGITSQPSANSFEDIFIARSRPYLSLIGEHVERHRGVTVQPRRVAA